MVKLNLVKNMVKGEVNYIELAEEVVKITGDMIVDRLTYSKVL